MSQKTKFKMESFGLTDIGRERSINQDMLLIDSDLHLYAVSDGMGGHKAGEVASRLAIQVLRDAVKSHLRGEHRRLYLDLPIVLEKGVRSANDAVHQKSLHNHDLEGMGATLTALLIDGDRLFLAHVGDSRAYLIRDQQIWQLSLDHTLLAEQVAAGLLPREALYSKMKSSTITRSIGHTASVQIDLFARTIQAGDVYLLCTDGLSGMLEDNEIAHIISKTRPPQSLQELVRMANERGGDDNITVVMIEIKN